jgi:hypothetical protein
MMRRNRIPYRILKVLAAGMWLGSPASALPPTDASPARPATSQPAEDAAETMDDLVRRLREGRGGSEDISRRIVRLMDGSQRRLARDFDTGETTQLLQQQIIRELDAAIDIAKRNLRPSPSPNAQQPQRGDKRKAGRRQREQQAKSTGEKRPSEAGQEDSTVGAPAADRTPNGQRAHPRRSWGNLPDRDREAVIQAFKEDFLRKYGELIEEYYRALSEESEE